MQPIKVVPEGAVGVQRRGGGFVSDFDNL